MVFATGSAKVKGLVHGTHMVDYSLAAADRTLRFLETDLGAANVYGTGTSSTRIRKCRLAEVFALDDAVVNVRKTTIDGTGGYIAARDRSRLEMDRCTITCLVVARADATIILEDCDIVGDVLATERSTIKLIGCRVTGRVIVDPDATLIER
jgi:hypothetical protein